MATILLVDDDRMVLELCHRVLSELRGVHILKANGGREAIDIAGRRAAAIELLISDLLMPGGVNGLELAEQLTRSRPAIKVLLMSAMGPDGFVLKPSWQFLAKPFRPLDLISKVNSMLAVAQPARIGPSIAFNKPAQARR